MTDDATPPSTSMILYRTADGRTRVECRFAEETLWLTQAQMAELFQTSIPNINIHLRAIQSEGEIDPAATIKSYLIVQQEGSRTVSRPVLHHALPVILAVGFRVHWPRTTPRPTPTRRPSSRSSRTSCIMRRLG